LIITKDHKGHDGGHTQKKRLPDHLIYIICIDYAFAVFCICTCLICSL
jgi:putative lipase involved disintegration of autophagic bodies